MADAPNLFKERILKTKNGFHSPSFGGGWGEANKQTILKTMKKINFQKTKQL